MQFVGQLFLKIRVLSRAPRLCLNKILNKHKILNILLMFFYK